jgi:hypothetical protein
LLSSFKGEKNCMSITYWPERSEVYVSHESGKLSVYDTARLEKGPISKKKKHLLF